MCQVDDDLCVFAVAVLEVSLVGQRVHEAELAVVVLKLPPVPVVGAGIAVVDDDVVNQVVGAEDFIVKQRRLLLSRRQVHVDFGISPLLLVTLSKQGIAVVNLIGQLLFFQHQLSLSLLGRQQLDTSDGWSFDELCRDVSGDVIVPKYQLVPGRSTEILVCIEERVQVFRIILPEKHIRYRTQQL